MIFSKPNHLKEPVATSVSLATHLVRASDRSSTSDVRRAKTVKMALASLTATLLMALGITLSGAAKAQNQSVPLVDSNTVTQQAPEAGTGEPWFKQDIWRDPDRGFFFVPEEKKPAPKVTKKPQEEPKQAEAPKPKKFSDFRSSKEAQAEHDRLLDVAIFSPTEPNVLAYNEFKTQMLAASETFAAVTQRVIWNNPEIDYNSQRPAAGFAAVNAKEQTLNFEGDLLKQYAANYGILFFFRSDCAYCHEQVPILGELNYKYGFEILGVSMDNKPIKTVNKWVPDNGISMKVSEGKGIKVTPSMYLVAKDKSHSLFLGAGLIALDEVGYRLRLLTLEKAQDSYKPALQDPRIGRFATINR